MSYIVLASSLSAPCRLIGFPAQPRYVLTCIAYSGEVFLARTTRSALGGSAGFHIQCRNTTLREWTTCPRCWIRAWQRLGRWEELDLETHVKLTGKNRLHSVAGGWATSFLPVAHRTQDTAKASEQSLSRYVVSDAWTRKKADIPF
jgi:hypothetical protein